MRLDLNLLWVFLSACHGHGRSLAQGATGVEQDSLECHLPSWLAWHGWCCPCQVRLNVLLPSANFLDSCFLSSQLGYSRENPHPPDGWGCFLTPLSPGFLEAQDPPPVWISKAKDLLSCLDFRGKNIRLKFNLSLIFDVKLEKTLKNTKCKGAKVNKLFTFFPSIITRNTRDLMRNYSTVARWVWLRVKMCQAFQTLRCNNVATVFSILFAFSRIKGPAKELRLSLMLGEKYVNKVFLLCWGPESASVSPNLTFNLCEVLVEMTPAADFFEFNPPSRLDFQGLWSPL